MQTQNRLFGDKAENIVCEYMSKLGYKILHRNYYIHKYGEIDIVAKKSNSLSFVEVKTRSKISNIEAVRYCISKKKINNLKRCVDIYSQRENISDLDVKILGAFVYPVIKNDLQKIKLFLLE